MRFWNWGPKTILHNMANLFFKNHSTLLYITSKLKRGMCGLVGEEWGMVDGGWGELGGNFFLRIISMTNDGGRRVN